MGLTFRLGQLPTSLFTDASNNVGIGAAPSGSYKLEVTGTAKVSGILTLGSTISNGTYAYTLPSATGTLALTSALGDYLPLAGGTLTGALGGTSATFSGRLTSGGTVQITGAGSPTTGAGLEMGYGNFTAGRTTITSYNRTGAAYVGNDYNALDYIWYTSGSQKMTLTNAGNVGIGTDSPGTKLDVTVASNNKIQFGTGFVGSSGQYIGGFYYVSNKLSIQSFLVGTDYQPLLLAPSGGDVYIGTSTTDKNSRLVVYGSTSDGNTYAFRCFSSGSDILFGVRTDGYINTGSYTSSPYNLVRTGRVMMVDSAGGVGYQSSTRESKTNISNLEDISFVYKLNPVSFNYRKSEGTSNIFTDDYNTDIQYGLIADEVEKVNKDLVFYNDKDGGKELAGVEYGKLTAVLIKAIQELNERLNKAGL